MTTLFTILIIVAAIAMILVVLVQKSKGGGLSSSFSGSNAILGYKKTTDTVEKITWILASIIIVLSIVTVSIAPRGNAAAPVISAPVEQQSIPDMSDFSTLPAPSSDDAAGSNE